MIDAFVKRFLDNRDKLRESFEANEPNGYGDIVKAVIGILANDDYSHPDATRIICIDNGDYQGTLLFVVGASGYQPYTYWYARVSYGSCSYCDTFQGIRDNYGDENKASRVADYITLALHIVQAIKEMP